MKNAIILAGAASAMLGLCGCSPKAEEPAPTINASMRQVMEPEAENIWNTASNAYNAVGDGLDPSKLSDADWSSIEVSAGKLKDRAEYIENAAHISVAAANEPILGSQAIGEKGAIGKAWDAVGPDIIQERILKQPALFKQKAHALTASADAMHRAAQNRDAALLYREMSNLDEVCDGCHEPFWGTDEPPPPVKG